MSTYTTRYRLTFDDIHVSNPSTWKVEILKRDDTTGDGIYELTGSALPLKITRGIRSNDKYEPILGSVAEIGVVLTDDLPDTAKPYFTSPPEPADFYAIDETELRVDIYKDGILKWRGFCKPDYCQYQYTSKPYAFTIVATDRIALLSSQLVDISIAKAGNGYISLLDLLKDNGLFNTGISSELKVVSSLQYGTEVETFKDKSVRYELLIGDDGNPMNILDSLKAIAVSFGARIFYMDGSFWFQRIEDLITENPIVYTYGTDDVPTTETIAIRKVIKGEISSSDGIYSGPVNISIGSAYKQTQAELNYKFRGWLQNFAWQDWDGTSFDHWLINGNATIDRHGSGTDEDPYTLYFAKNADGSGTLWQSVSGIPNGSRFKLTMPIKFLKTDMTSLRFYIIKTPTGGERATDDSLKILSYRGGIWYPLAPGSGTDAEPGGKDNIRVQRPKADSIASKNNTLDFSLETTYFDISNSLSENYTGDLSFLLEIFDPNGSIADDTTYNGMEVGEIKLEVRADNFTGETDTIRIKTDYSKQNNVDAVSYIDNSVYIANSMYAAGIITNWQWHSDYFKRETKLQFLNLYTRINVYRKPYRILTGQFYSNTISFENVINQAFGDFPLFIQMYDEYDVKKCLHTMQLAEINHGVLDIDDIEKATTKQKT